MGRSHPGKPVLIKMDRSDETQLRESPQRSARIDDGQHRSARTLDAGHPPLDVGDVASAARIIELGRELAKVARELRASITRFKIK